MATHQKGVSFGQNEDSPWYRASFLAQGTSLKTEDDVSVQDVALLQFIDKDGDITWGYIDWNYSDAEFAEFYIMSGTGRVEVGALPPQELGAGDIVLIPPMCRQRITSIGSDDLIFLAICTPPFSQEVYEEL